MVTQLHPRSRAAGMAGLGHDHLLGKHHGQTGFRGCGITAPRDRQVRLLAQREDKKNVELARELEAEALAEQGYDASQIPRAVLDRLARLRTLSEPVFYLTKPPVFRDVLVRAVAGACIRHDMNLSETARFLNEGVPRAARNSAYDAGHVRNFLNRFVSQYFRLDWDLAYAVAAFKGAMRMAAAESAAASRLWDELGQPSTNDLSRYLATGELLLRHDQMIIQAFTDHRPRPTDAKLMQRVIDRKVTPRIAKLEAALAARGESISLRNSPDNQGL